MTPNTHVKNKTFILTIIIKTLRTENKDRILKAIRKKHQSPIKVIIITIITADFSTKTLKSTTAWNVVFQALETKQFQTGIILSRKAIIHN
jgi:hypothetical protein